ncbi:tetratricopeptide repeat protein [Actinomadura sp. KC216]|uniref:ATP-binding protein n=1 Tax=Actinomadura sp. KC216 TaxID=2530370 RepID=UPI0010478057|nr:tetratricopeptide repeat protein [Actinomadura sp. KC216]TDB83040.1 tetratricopeptide repeat protein [Actinomadura sp. KC216]
MDELAPAVHRTIVCVDVEGFGDQRRTHLHQVAVRKGVYRCLRTAFDCSGISWQDCYREDRGDGALVLVPSDVPKALVAARLPGELAGALAAHNQACDWRARIRLRLAVHAGEIHHDEHGVTGTAINVAFRLLAAEPLKRALAGSAGGLAVIASQWFYEEVIRHDAASSPATYRQVRVSVKETRVSAWICRPDDPYPPQQDGVLPPAPEVVVPRQLPAAVAGFAGRRAELQTLTAELAQLRETASAGGTVVISAIGGTAGIGKTALALHWAHQVAERFPDGQLYVNLRGFDPAGTPVTSAEAVRGFLDAFQVPAERIPVSLAAQAALFRSLLVGRRVLVVLDNARDTDQIRPLLPGSPGCVVVVTSRNQLTSLISTEGARPISLDLLRGDEGRQLLAHRIGPGRVEAEPRVVAEIIDLCARLPLALSIVAARAASHPTFPLAALADELRETHHRLEALNSGESSTRAVFSWSYRQLTPQAARLFRLLGLHPGREVTVPAAAGLADVPVVRARALVAELARTHMITEPAPGRFTFHDLLRAYAAELARAHEQEPERHAALDRMLDHYLHTAYAAALLLYPTAPVITLPPPRPGARAQGFADYAAASAWFDAEYPVLLAAVEHAAVTGRHTHAWQLCWTLVVYVRPRGHWHDWIATHHTALAAARQHADRWGQAHTHAGLGGVYSLLGRYGQAHTHLRKALHLFRDLADQANQAHTLVRLGTLFEYQDRYEEALSYTHQALALSRAAAHRRVQASSLNNIGWYHALHGNPRQTLDYCRQALTLNRELGDRQGEANNLHSLGYAHHLLGQHRQAAAYFQQALRLHGQVGNQHFQANGLDHLGDTHHATGDLAAARAAWQQALDILDQISLIPHMGAGYPDPDIIRAKLRGPRSDDQRGP